MSDTSSSSTKTCPFCAETIQAAAIVCRYCRRDLPRADDTLPSSDDTPTSVPFQAAGAISNVLAEQPEVIYLRNTDVTVTNTRILIGGKTYALANVTSVILATVLPDTSGATAGGCMGTVFGLVVAGMAALLSFTGGEIFGVIVAIVSVIGAIQVASTKRTKYYVKLGSASGESNALWAHNKEYIQKIVDAVNEAIIKRG